MKSKKRHALLFALDRSPTNDST